jgi:zinc protease
MGRLLPALSADRFETQRGVVLNERRQSYENRPYGLAQFAIMEALFPSSHPYNWPTIGRPADLAAATLDDVRDFFVRYYHPGNASIVIAGDVGVEEALSTVEEFFGEIPAGPSTASERPGSETVEPRRLALQDRVELPRLYVSWRSPAMFAEGDAELDLFGDLIGNGRSSRLYRRLIHDRRIAAELAAGQASREWAGTFQIIASAAPGHTLDDLETAIYEEIERFTDEGPTVDELERGLAQAEASFVLRLQSLGGFGGKADQLNAYNVYLDAPNSFDADLDRYRQATADKVRTTAASWLDPRQAVVLSVIPEGRRDLAANGTADVMWSA